MDEKMGPETDVQFWCEEYVKNQSLMGMINGTWGFHPNPTIWGEMHYIACLKLFAYVVVFTGGLLGNVSVILSVWLNRSMRNTTNYYVANLAVSDALICIFCMVPEALTTGTQGYFLLGKFMCNFTSFMPVACLTSSSLTLTAISCDRSVAILYPFRSRVTKQRSSLVIAFIWVISIAVAVPSFINSEYVMHKFENFEIPQCRSQWSETYQYDASSDEKCHPYHTSFIVYLAVGSVVLFFLPMLIMVTAYSLILWRLWKTKVPGEQLAANVDAHARAKRKVNKMVFVVLVVFIICWTPEEVLVFNYVVLDSTIDAKNPDWYIELYWFSVFLAYANSFLNPFIYGGFNRSFLKGFTTILRKPLRCGFISKTKKVSDRFRITFTTAVPKKSTASKRLDEESHKSVELKLLKEANGNVSKNAMDS